MADLDIPFGKYAEDAYQRNRELARIVKNKDRDAKGMLGGKSAAQGEGYPGNNKAAAAALDATQNVKEEEMEDMQRRYEINKVRGGAQAWENYKKNSKGKK